MLQSYAVVDPNLSQYAIVIKFVILIIPNILCGGVDYVPGSLMF